MDTTDAIDIAYCGLGTRGEAELVLALLRRRCCTLWLAQEGDGESWRDLLLYGHLRGYDSKMQFCTHIFLSKHYA